MKICKKCGECLPLCEFHRAKKHPDGLQYSCKKCLKEVNAQRYVKNREHILACSREWENQNREKKNAAKRKRYTLNQEKERALSSEWKRKNRDTATLFQKMREAKKRGATPSWFEKDAVSVVYKKASEYGLQVDHIVPLSSKLVCGLHCWANLQLLDSSLNGSKSNRYWPDMP